MQKKAVTARKRPPMVYNPPPFPGFKIIFQDDHIVVVEKPSGLLSVPGKALEHKDSLQLRLQRVWPELTVVHRLDMATSGLIVFALNKASHRHIQQQFEKRLVSKTYYARVLGVPNEKQGEVSLPLICDWPNRPMQMVDMKRGKPATTYYEVVENDSHSSLIKLTPITGRSHQLRVHMLELGHPILGDKLYASEVGKKMANHLCLHAAYINFTHPVTHTQISFNSQYQFELN